MGNSFGMRKVTFKLDIRKHKTIWPLGVDKGAGLKGKEKNAFIFGRHV